jgi:hypothetical protein
MGWCRLVLRRRPRRVKVKDTMRELDSAGLARIRTRLVERLAKLPAEGSVMDLQLEMAAAHDIGNDHMAVDPVAAKRHVHLLRVIADGLAWRLLDPHLIRTLAKNPGPPAKITRHDPGFAFTIEVAYKVTLQGQIAIVNDLTNFLRIGDITAVGLDGATLIECKATQTPRLHDKRGRRARQRERGEKSAEYLNTSETQDSEGGTVVAVDIPDIPPKYDAVRDLLRELKGEGKPFAIRTLGNRDVLAVVRGIEEGFGEALSNAVSGWVQPLLATHTDNVDDPRWFVPPVTAYEIDVDDMVAALEGELVFVRIVDLHEFETSGPDGESPFRLGRRFGEYVLEYREGPEGSFVSGRYIDAVMLSPTPVAETVEALRPLARSATEFAKDPDSYEQSPGAPLPARYVTAFKGDGDEIHVATRLGDLPLTEQELSSLTEALRHVESNHLKVTKNVNGAWNVDES